ncbi:unnamed protein product [Anisakis simplex]|uniref:Na_H_Exchanger domain-containing protein n=1 Tax=Anisakis simplex TaxID=6269 RepID=A0A0M3KG22_ANISI|nr:unnamed protein product [Anisakis simplex]
MPALFVLIGYDFDFSTVDYALALRGMIVLAIGICLRILCCYILTFGANFNRSEQIFVSLAFISKATVQAALVPQLVQLTAGTQYSTQSAIILDTCVFAILITAPFGQLILRVLGPKTLKTSRCRSPKQAPTKQQQKQQHIQPTIVWIQCD